jgi:hypothetical protein
VTAIIDTREQNPLDLSPLQVTVGTLSTGDYLLGWIAAGVPVVMAEDHDRAGRYVSRILYIAARRRWREARALVAEVLNEGTE